jgi:GTPase
MSEHGGEELTRCGYVAIVGRPNVGKSTLLNHMLKQKISITSRKPQTTRHNVLGIKTESSVQIIFVDTPGLHLKHGKAINRYMNRAATTAIKDVDVVVFVVDKLAWTDEDDMVVQRLQNIAAPIILAVNKVDQLDNKESLLPHLQKLSETLQVEEIIPISALRQHNLDTL